MQEIKLQKVQHQEIKLQESRFVKKAKMVLSTAVHSLKEMVTIYIYMS